jgi:beta-lactamase regulating signal transducer with metallopeptidase domain
MMLLAWMAYSVLLGALVYGAALAAERMTSVWGRSSRFIWVAAAIIASVVPVIFATLPRSAAAVATVGRSAGDSVAATDFRVSFDRAPRAQTQESVAAIAQRIVAQSDNAVLGAWALASLVWVVLIARAAVGIRRRRARWQVADVDGIRVLVAPDVGPAVVGALSPRIIFPRWALSLDASARALMLRHEAEHVRARDPLLLFAVTAATAALPWNAALWLIVRRLRLAIEIDCDRRVLRSSVATREYGELLLTVGARSSAPLPLATSLAERRPLLELRIKAMTALSPRYPRILTAGCIALVGIASIAASRVPRPSPLVRQTVPSLVTPVVPNVVLDDSRLPATPTIVPPAILTPTHIRRPEALTPKPRLTPPALPLAPLPVANPDSLTVAEIRALIAAHHPSVLTGDPDINTITLVVDARGNYVVSTAESRPIMAPALMPGEGRGGRGRSGGAAPAMVGGGDGVYARGRVGGGGAIAPMDSATVAAREAEMSALAAKLAAQGADTAYRQRLEALQAKLAAARGDTVVLRQEKRIFIGDGVVRRATGENAKPMSSERMKEAGTAIGLNMDALSRLIDPASIESVQIQLFAAGQMGPSLLRVFVVHQQP